MVRIEGTIQEIGLGDAKSAAAGSLEEYVHAARSLGRLLAFDVEGPLVVEAPPLERDLGQSAVAQGPHYAP